ncbi:Arm DNA-binding domain-containing protein [Oryzomicrobium sp.]|uniref:Arm DNA-binding domain-containing protein n=1 Tax=Oryzomicrobium sp. TaxID=1911578 RepID=UPI003FA683E6
MPPHRLPLTDALLETLQGVSRSRFTVLDAKLPGFQVEVSGRHKRFVVRTRGHYKTIGRWPLISLHEARAAAYEFLRLGCCRFG